MSRYLVLTMLCFLFGCQSLSKLSKKKVCRVEINQTEMDFKGLPLKLEGIDFLDYEIANNQEIIDTIRSVNSLLRLKRNRNIISFQFIQDDKGIIIRGEFIIPNFKSIDYVTTFGVEEMRVTSIRPYSFYSLIRCGQWTFIEKGREKVINYDITINGL